VLALIAASLLWYFAADRLTPHTTQARVQAFVVPVAAEVAGKVLAVHVRNNDEVQAGQPLFDIDPSQYRIALQRSRSDYESVQRSVNASAATVEAARASLQAAQANHVKADKDATRQETLYAEDPGAISVRRLEVAQATGIQARSQEKAAEADLRKAQEAAGESGDNNAQLRSARSAIEKAELDLARTRRWWPPPAGVVTDLRTDVGHFAQAGAGDDADRDPRPVDQCRPDREQPRQHRSRRRGGDRPRRAARRSAQGPRAQCRRRRQFRPAGAAGYAADDPEQPRLAAPGAALPGGDRVRRRRSAALARSAPAARPR
jgi:multidrug efflux pump subunit AcrA (membrane-fusion protein)